MSASPSRTGGVGRSSQRGGSCTGASAPKAGAADQDEDQPRWRKTRFARCGGSRPMDEPERCPEPGNGQ
jgi:hypothetical protein